MRARVPSYMALLIGAALGATVGLAATGGLAPTARAFPSRVTLDDVTFSDGGTASGFFTLNVSGFLTNPTSVTTAVGSVLPGTSYSLSGPFSKTATDVEFTHTHAHAAMSHTLSGGPQPDLCAATRIGGAGPDHRRVRVHQLR